MKNYLDALDHCDFGNERNVCTHTHTHRKTVRLSKKHIESGFKSIHFLELCMKKD